MGQLLVAFVLIAGEYVAHAARGEEINVCHVLSLFENVLIFVNGNSLKYHGDPLNESLVPLLEELYLLIHLGMDSNEHLLSKLIWYLLEESLQVLCLLPMIKPQHPCKLVEQVIIDIILLLDFIKSRYLLL